MPDFKSLNYPSRFLKTVTLLIGLVYLGGCATVPRPDITSYIPLKHICENYGIDWSFDSVSQVITMNKGGVEAKALVGSETVIVNGRQVSLSSPVARRDNLIVVPPDFNARVVSDFVAAKPVVSNKYRKIIIDPGHGGKDPGATGYSGTREKDVVLDIARRLRDDLQRNGFKVQMTRSSDNFISLEKRTEIASRSGADLFISIHANASASRNARGIEIYTLRHLSYQEKNEPQRQRNYWLMYDTLNMDKNDAAVKGIVEDMMFTHKVPEAVALADYIRHDLSAATSTEDRGMKKAGFFVLRNTLIPAILIETGFLTNPQEERLLQSSAYRQKIADGVAESILRYSRRY